MMKQRHFFLKSIPCFFLFFFADELAAQTNYVAGYVITHQNDTLKGFIDDRNWEKNPESIRFKQALHLETFETYTADKVAGIYIKPADEYYVSYIGKIDKLPSINLSEFSSESAFFAKDFHETDTLFLNVLIRGSVSLFYYVDKYEKKHYFIQKKQGEIVELIDQKYIVANSDGTKFIRSYELYKSQIRDFFSDCHTLASDIKKIEYTSPSLSNLLLKYQNCMNISIDYLKKKDPIRAELGVVAGVAFTSLRVVSQNLETNYGTSFSPCAGLSVSFVHTRNRRAWSIYSDILWKRMQYEKEVSNGINAYMRDLDVDYLRLNIMLRYKFPMPTQKFRPYLQLGISNSLAIRMDETIISTYSNGGARKHEQGLIGGAGIRSGRLSGEIRYELGNGISPFPALSTPTRSIYMMASYQLSKR